MAYLTKTDPMPVDIEGKRQMLLRNGIALWDVVATCDIVGSSDSRMTNVVPTDLSIILKNSPIRQIFANGNKAYELYRGYGNNNIHKLPSTSPANAVYDLEKLMKKWSVILLYL